MDPISAEILAQQQKMIQRRDLETHVRGLLKALNHDVNSEELKETPRRVASYLLEAHQQPDFKLTTFIEEDSKEMIWQQNIPWSSLCAHHMLPFMGTAVIAYVPANGRIVGLSKLARTLHHFAAGLQTQERITTAVADFLYTKLNAIGVGVKLNAQHLCMEVRGVKAHGTWTSTVALRGCFEHGDSKSEFLQVANGHK